MADAIGDKDKLAAAKKAQDLRQRCWMKRKSAKDTGWRVTKRHRVSSKSWLDSFDAQVRISLGLRGLVDFLPDASDILWRNWRTWRHMLLSIDQGADGLSATNFLKHLGMNISIACDFSHGANNDYHDAVKDIGLQPWWLLMMLTFNIEHGPWGEDLRWNQILECFKELEEHGAPKRCELFLAYAPQMLDELRGYDRFVLQADEDPEVTLWRFVMDEQPLKNKGTKAQLARFMDSRNKAAAFVHLWSVKRFAYEYCAIESGMVRTKVASLKVQPPPANDDHSTTDPARLCVTEQALKSSCANSLVIACMMLEEDWNRSLCRAVVFCSQAVAQWHSHQNRELRSTSGAEKWLVDQTTGGFQHHVKDILKVASHEPTLESIGFVLKDAAVANNEWTAIEADLAHIVGGFIVALASRRESRCLWLTRGWPARMAAVMGSDADAIATLSAFRDDLAAFRALQSLENKTKVQDTMLARSVFNETIVKQYVEASLGTLCIIARHVLSAFRLALRLCVS